MSKVRSDRWRVGAIVLAGLLASLFMAHVQHENAQLRLKQLVSSASLELSDQFKAQLASAIGLVKSTSWLFYSQHQPSRQQFHDFASPALQAGPLLRELQWRPIVSRQQRAAYIASARRDGIGTFEFLEPNPQQSAGTLQVAAEREQYCPIFYGEPRNRVPIGLDTFWSDADKTAMNEARDTGKTIASHTFHPVWAENSGEFGTIGFTINVPIYASTELTTLAQRRDNLRGYATGFIFASSLFQTLAGKADKLNADVLVFDSTPTKPDLIFRALGKDSDLAPDVGDKSYREQAFDQHIRIDVAGRSWVLIVHPRPAFFSIHYEYAGLWTLLTGLAFTLLFAMALHRLLRGRRVLEESQQLLHDVTDHLPVGVFQTYSKPGQDRRLTFVNQSASRLLGVPIESMLAHLEYAFMHVIEEDQIRLVGSMDQAKRTRRVWEEEFRVVVNNQQRWMYARALPREENDGSLYFNGYIEDISDRKHVELTLTNLNLFQQELIDTIPSPIFFKGPDARFLGCNRAYEHAFGTSRNYLKGKTVLDLEYLPEADRIAYHAEDVGVIAQASTLHREFPIRYDDGKDHQVLYWVSGFHLSDGKPGGLVGVLVDISAQTEAQLALSRAIEQTNAIFDSAPLGIAEFRERHLVRCNRQWEIMLGYKPGELDGKSSRIWFTDDENYLRLGWIAYPILAKGETYSGDWLLKRKDNGIFWCRMTAHAINPQDALKSSVWQFEDITEKRLAEEQLRQARDTAEEATLTKSMFLANMSHEIRTPMNAVIGLAHLALKTDLSDKQRDYLNKIHNAGLSLLAVINDILDFSKIEAGRIEMEQIEFSLDQVMDSITTTIGHQVAERGLELLFDIADNVPRSMVGDPLRLGQVLLNLVSNAIKFTEQGEIIVRCELLDQLADSKIKLQFSVIDTGIGMSEDERQRLFQPFTQADGSTTRKYGGTGLGLTICKRLVALMNGDIEVESEPGHGTRFSFTAHFGSTLSEKPRVVPKELNDLHVLIVDDNAAARTILSSQLAFLPFTLHQSRSGKEAIAFIKQSQQDHPVDLVLMDWKMPKMSGTEAIRLIKLDTSLSKIPKIVMVTAYGRDEVMRECEDLELDAFLLKPISQSNLVDTLIMLYTDGAQDVTNSQEGLQPDYDLTGMRLLLVEDNVINQQIAQELLENVGAGIDVADNGQKALDILSARPTYYHAVLMDLQMPVMDGYTATTSIRMQPRFRDLPILAMTAHATLEERQRCLDIGMNAHITKPIEPHVLYQTMSYWYAHSVRETGLMEKKQIDVQKNDRLDIPGINVHDALKRVAGNRKLYQSLLEQFLNSHAASAQELHEFLVTNHIDKAKQLLHNIKGVAGNLGADSLSRRAGELEQLILSGGEPAMALMRFENSMAETLAAIHQTIQSKPTQDNDHRGAASSSEINQIMKNLAFHLANHDADALEYLNQHLAKFGSQLPKIEYEKMLRAIRIFDFSTALELLTQIAIKIDMQTEADHERKN